MAENYQVQVRLQPPTQVVVQPAPYAAIQAVQSRPPEIKVGVAERGAKGEQGPVGPQGPQGLAGSLLSQLGDVQLTTPTQNDVLAYNQAINKWINRPEAAVTDGGNF